MTETRIEQIEKDEYTMKLKIKGLEHVWVNPTVYNAIRKEERQDTAREILNIIGQSPMGVIDEDKFKEIKRIGGLE